MKYCYLILILVMFLSCNSESSETPQPVQASKPKSSTPKDSFHVTELNDTVRVDFKARNLAYSPSMLNSIIKEIVLHGAFRPDTDKKGKMNIYQDSDRNLRIAYDSADMHYFITHEYLLSNIHIASVNFSAPRTKKNPEFKPRFVLQEWTFNNNNDRDSAFNIVRYVSSHPKSIVMYFKSYPQIIKAENRIIFLTTGSDIFERYVIKYGKIVEALIKKGFQ